MRKLTRFCRGYVRIRIRGFSPERFVNLCGKRGILLWELKRGEADDYEMNLSLADFRRIREISRKTHVKVVLLGRFGLPFLMSRMRSRRMFLLGMLAAVLFWIWSAGFVWEIELEGNMEITQDIMTDFLKEQDVRIGMSKKDLDIALLEKEIRRSFPFVTWTSAKLQGTRLTISLKENEVEAYREESAAAPPKDLISAYDGTIAAMIVRSGVPRVKIGDSVSEGTVLVEGRIPILSDDGVVLSYQEVVSDADIVLECEIPFSDSLPFTYIDREYTGRRKSRPILKLGERELTLPLQSTFLLCDSVVTREQPSIFEKLQIPIFWGRETYREYRNVEHEYTLSEAESLLRNKILNFLAGLEEKGVQILSKDVRIDTRDGMWVLEGEIRVLQPVGELADPPAPENAAEGEPSLEEGKQE